jgi:uncharacterized membrane protein YgcG
MPRLRGDLRVLGGSGAGFAPLGADVGAFLGALLAAHAAARARTRAAEAQAARGGYARFTAEKTRDRWASFSSELAGVVAETWGEFAVRFLDVWDADRTGGARAGGGTCGGGAAAALAATGHAHGGSSGGGGGCCDHGAPAAAAAAALPDDGFWRGAPLAALRGALRDSFGFAAIEILRRIRGADRLAPELEVLSPPALRTGAEARLVALARWLLAAAEGVAAAVAARAGTASDRKAALQTFACGWDAAVAAATAMDSEPGWPAALGEGGSGGGGGGGGGGGAATGARAAEGSIVLLVEGAPEALAAAEAAAAAA